MYTNPVVKYNICLSYFIQFVTFSINRKNVFGNNHLRGESMTDSNVRVQLPIKTTTIKAGF